MSEEDIDFLMSIQGLEQPEFDNAYLERENKKLEKEIERLNNIIEIKNERIQQLMNRTKSTRIRKAIEYIEKHKKMTRGWFNGKWWVKQHFELVCDPKELLEILKGEEYYGN